MPDEASHPDARQHPAPPSPIFTWRLLLRVCGTYALVFAAVFWFLWSPGAAPKTLGWDMVTEYWGDIADQAEHLLQTGVPGWNPFERLGFPSYADPQAGQFYPINWLFYPLTWILGETPFWVVVVKNWLHLVLGAAGTFFFLRRRGDTGPACWAGGFLFALSTPLITFVASALLWPFAWLPVVWIALDWLLDKPGLRRGLWTGWIVALPVLAGNPPSLFYLGLGGLFFAVQRVVEALRARDRADRLAYLGQLGIAALAGGLVLAIAGMADFLPVQQVFTQSVRTVRNERFVLGTNLTSLKLLGLLVPNLSNRGFHYGLISLCLAAFALWKAPRAHLWAALLALFAVNIAVGQHGFLLPLLSGMPPFNLFRGPHRYAVLFSAALAVWAPAGISLLMRAAPDVRVRAARWLGLVGAFCFVVLGATALALVVVKRGSRSSVEVEALSLGALLALLCTGAAVLLGRPSSGATPRLWPWSVVGLVVLSLWLGAMDAHHLNDFPRPTTRRDSHLNNLSFDALQMRIYDDRYLRYRPGVRLGVRDASGYEGDPLGALRYDRLIRKVRRRPKYLAHLNVHFYLRGTDHPKLRPRLASVEKNRAFEPIRNGIWRVKNPSPPVYVVPRVERVNKSKEALVKWLRSKPGTVAVVADEDDDSLITPTLTDLTQAEPGPAQPGRLIHLTPNRVEAEVDSERGGLAVFAEAFYPGWRAAVDGRPAPIHRVNYLFRGVPVPPGRHTVSMRFDPWRYRAAVIVFWLGILLPPCVEGVRWGWRRRRRAHV